VSEIGKPQARSYFAAAQAFRDGTDTPRAFLERCVVTIEVLDPQVGAFVATNLPAARTAADAATARWRSRTPLSLIDSMPVGIKDIMETADMVTERSSPPPIRAARATPGTSSARRADRAAVRPRRSHRAWCRRRSARR
jgi:Asp-tRNA(Asn)/Glu-tRNA(Gln) amidotransferase A subunit family amidase